MDFFPYVGVVMMSMVSGQAIQAPLLQEGEQRPAGVWLDVRTVQEYEMGHLEGALNIPLHELEAHISSTVPDRNESIYVYCRSGARAQQAVQRLQQLGYQKMINYGGYEDLKSKGY